MGIWHRAAVMVGCGGASSKRLFISIFLTGLVVSVAGTSPVIADTSDQAKAEDLIRQANDLRRRGENVAAFRLLSQAYEIARTPRTAAQLGLSELTLGYWVAARDHLAEALTSVGHHPWIDENRKTLEAQLAKADSHIGEIVLDGKPDGAEVLLNGKLVGKLPLSQPIRTSEGKVDLEIRAQGHETITRTLTIAGRAHERVSINLVQIMAPPAVVGPAAAVPTVLEPAPTAAARQEPLPLGTTSELPRWRRILPWTLLVGSVASAAIGVWQHVEWRLTQSDFEVIPSCGEDLWMRGPDPRCRRLFEDLDTSRTRTFVAYGTAALLGGAAATLFLVNGSAADRVMPGIAAGPGTFYASCRIHF
jgi:hypothetical protein